MNTATDGLIVALDLDSRAAAETLIEKLGDSVSVFKIGYQLFYGGDGLSLGKALIAAGKKVFFDLKMHDIPNTVAHGVAAIAQTGAHMVTVHAYPQTMMAAADAAAGSDLCVLGVTVLTSMDDSDVRNAGYRGDVAGLIAQRLEQARASTIGGVVCSPLEAQLARRTLGPKMAVVTPGIRPAGAARGDQKRVLGPREALEAGASHLVVGRPITAASDPKAAAEAIVAEMNAATRRA